MNYRILFMVCLTALSSSAQYSIQLPSKNVTVVAKDGKATFSGSTLSNEACEPQLPRYSVSFLLPPTAIQSSVQVTLNNLSVSTLQGNFTVAPSPAPVTSNGIISWPKGKRIVDGKDADIYETDAFFPSSHTDNISVSQLRQYKLAEVTIFPYRFNPVTGKLQVITGGTLTITFSESAAKNTVTSSSIVNGISSYTNDIIGNAVNFSSVNALYGTPASSEARALATVSGRFVIITTNAIVSSSTQLANFVAAKQAKGFTVQVVTETQWGGGTGNTAANNIRNWLRNNYLSLNISNVLLIGDPHPETGTVPMKMCFPRSLDTDYKECPTDFYYAELSGNWDIDGDGQYGEFEDFQLAGGADKFAEVFIGRFPYYGVITDLDKIISKTISYDNQTDKTWRRNILLPMKPLDAGTSGISLAQEIKNQICIPNSFKFYRLGDTIFSDQTTKFTDVLSCNPFPEMIPCNQDNVVAIWSTKPFGLVTWLTHGWSMGGSDIFSSEMNTRLNDSRPSFTFQASCSNGEPEVSANLGYSLLVNGAIGTVSASRVSWYYGNQTNFWGTPTILGMGFVYSHFLVTSKHNAGEALVRCKMDNPCDGSAWWMNVLDFNLYGSPDMALDVPAPTYLSNLPMVSSVNGWGPVEKDMSNGETNATDGAMLGVGDMLFPKGLGAHSVSEVIYNLGKNYSTFNTWIGIDRESGSSGTVAFHVFGDGASIYNSGLQSGAMPPRNLSLNVANINQLRLVVNDYDAIGTNDHADWADAHLIGGQSQAQSFTLKTFASGTGVVSISPVKSTYNAGETVTLTAQPFSGSQFTNWSGNASGSTNPLSVIINSNTAITANFNSSSTGEPVRMEVETFSSASGYSTLTTGTKGLPAADFSNGTGKYSGGSGVRACQSSFPGTSASYTINFRWYDMSASVTTGYYRIVITEGTTDVFNQQWYGNANTTGWYTQSFNNVTVNNGAQVRIYAERTSPNDPVIMDFIEFIPATGPTPTVYSIIKSINGNGYILSNPSGNSFEQGTMVSLTAVPTTGSLFTGWSGDIAGSTNPQTISVNANRNITATFSNTSTFSVAYNRNGSTGGSVPVDAFAYQSGATVTVLGNTGSLVRTGYNFAGWNTNASGTGTTYMAGQAFTISANVTLYALWQLSGVTLSYNGNGNTGGDEPDSYTYSYGSTATVSGRYTLSRVNYEFSGWNTAANGSGTAYSAGQTFVITSNITLYAQWTPSTTCPTVRMELENFSSVSGYSTLTIGAKNPPAASEYSNSTGKYSGGTGMRACQRSFTGNTCTYSVQFRWYDRYVNETTSSYRIVIKNGTTTVLDQTWTANKGTTGWYTQTFNNIAVNNGASVVVYAQRSSGNDPVIMDYVDFIGQ